MSSKRVALALSSGGPRGFSYIGAIEELLSRGYEITSVAGTSVGSLVGGIYAAGGLSDFRDWLFSLDPSKVVRLMDFSISKNYLMKGDRVISAIKKVVPDRNIEDLNIPFRCVATDLYSGKEVVFSEGPLFAAIRASISIPSMFRPVRRKGRILVDGGLVNTFPLDRVPRHRGDILVGCNVNAASEESGSSSGADRNYYTILDRSFSIMNQTIARMAIDEYRPDILVELPFDAYTAIADYGRAREISDRGRVLMAEALDRYEARPKGLFSKF